MDSCYCYPNSDVLINKFNIRNITKLHDVERKLTSLRIQDLLESPIQGKFDFIHLQK